MEKAEQAERSEQTGRVTGLPGCIGALLHRRASTWRILFAVSAFSALSAFSGLHAQDDPRLMDAVRLAQDGLGDSARAVVTRLRDATDPADSLYPQALYTLGLVSKTVDEMRRNYQRISVEYASSTWADDAVLRLAMLDFAAGNPAGTVRNIERIRSDYPSSPLLGIAAYWAVRVYFDLKKPAEACRWVSTGLAQASDNIELQNQLNYYQNRCSALASQPVESTRTDSLRPGPLPKPPPKAGFSVQVAAVKTEVAAAKVTAALKASGFEPHTVKDVGLFKVRVGHFADRAGAQATVVKVKAKLGGTPYVVQES